jgi:hypothetical protein
LSLPDIEGWRRYKSGVDRHEAVSEISIAITDFVKTFCLRREKGAIMLIYD